MNDKVARRHKLLLSMDLEDLTITEIAHMFGTTNDTIKNDCQRLNLTTKSNKPPAPAMLADIDIPQTMDVKDIMITFKLPYQAVYYLEMGLFGESRVKPIRATANTTKPDLSGAYMKFISKIYGNKCWVCGKKKEILYYKRYLSALDHGISTPLNLAPCCKVCELDIWPKDLVHEEWNTYLGLFRLTHINEVAR